KPPARRVRRLWATNQAARPRRRSTDRPSPDGAPASGTVRAMTDTGAASRSHSRSTVDLHPTGSARAPRGRLATQVPRAGLALLALALLASLALAQDEPHVETAPAVDTNPVLLQVGASVERLSDVQWRFDVAVRSYLSGQGMPYTPETAAQLRGLMPNYLEQRASEVVLLREAARRQLEPDQASIDATLERIKS